MENKSNFIQKTNHDVNSQYDMQLNTSESTTSSRTTSSSTSSCNTTPTSTTSSSATSEQVYTHLDIVPGCASFLQSLSANMMGKKRHPVAEKYWLDYRSTRCDLAWDILHHFGASLPGYKLKAKYTLIHFDSDMGEDVSSHEEYLNEKKRRTSQITLSTQHVDNPERMRDVMLHELCHAGVWQIHGHTDEKIHGPKWKCLVERLKHLYPYINIKETCSEADDIYLDNVPGCASFLESLSEDMMGKKRHPAAQEYFQDYRSKRLDLAWDIVEHFDATVCDYKLDFENVEIYFNNQMFKYVSCHHECFHNDDRHTKLSKIYLSIRCLDNPERLRDALLHELCHAMVWQIDDFNDGVQHGPKFQWWIQHLVQKHPCINVEQVVGNADYECKKYLYECVKCGYDIGEKKTLPQKYRKRCIKCGERFRLVKLQDHKLDTRSNVISKKITSKISANSNREPLYTHFDNVPECASFLESLSEDMNGKKRHPVAHKYWLDYRSNRSDLARDIYEIFNVSVCGGKLHPNNMQIFFDNQMWNEIGYHHNDSEVQGQKSSHIYLSIRWLENPERLRDTLLHELCHATVWQIDDAFEDNHGPKFQWWIQHLGRIHPYINAEEVAGDANYQSDLYLYECVKCGYDIGAIQPLPKKYRKRCIKCGWRLRLVKLQAPTLHGIQNAYYSRLC